MKPIELDFYVLTIDQVNSNYRKFSENVINEWILDLQNTRGYKIEFAVNINEEDLTTTYVKDTLYCGLVTNLTIKEKDGKKLLFAHAKFKVKGPFANEMNEPNFFNNLTLVPKGIGKVSGDNNVYDYTLIGFHLILKNLSSFI